MAKKFRFDSKGFGCLSLANQVVYEGVADAMDDIRGDLKTVSSSLAPKKTGKLEKNGYSRKINSSLKSCSFTLKYTADNKGFDYATWTHDESYNLGKESKKKRPVNGRFAKGSLRVGQGYVSQAVDASEGQWADFISFTVTRKLKQSIKRKSK